MSKRLKQTITGWNCSTFGFGYFLSKPKLWFVPLLTTLLCWILLFIVFFLTMYFSWPASHIGWSEYTLKIFQALGIASVVIVIFWCFVIPGFLNWAFENMVRKIFLTKGESLPRIKYFQSFTSSFYIMGKTLFWRVLWLIAVVICSIFFGVIGLLLSQIALGHIALLDACDLCLSIRGFKGKDRYQLLKANTIGILSGGLLAGVLSFALVPTVIGWIFWLPGVYSGAALWTIFWEKDFVY